MGNCFGKSENRRERNARTVPVNQGITRTTTLGYGRTVLHQNLAPSPSTSSSTNPYNVINGISSQNIGPGTRTSNRSFGKVVDPSTTTTPQSTLRSFGTYAPAQRSSTLSSGGSATAGNIPSAGKVTIDASNQAINSSRSGSIFNTAPSLQTKQLSFPAYPNKPSVGWGISSLEPAEGARRSQGPRTFRNRNTAKSENSERRGGKPNSGRNPEEYFKAIKLLSEITFESELNLKAWLNYAKQLNREDGAWRWEYENILTYINNGQVHEYGIDVQSIVKISQRNVTEFRNRPNFNNSEKRMMLWHGTHKRNLPAILQHGLRLPDDKGQPAALRLMQGVGIYFADRASKSANYSKANKYGNPTNGEEGILFLCDVLLGRQLTKKDASHELTTAPSGFNSVKCPGKRIPCFKGNKRMFGSLLPAGETVDNEKFPDNNLIYNEYTIYNPDQINIKYVVHFKFTLRPVRNLV